MKNQPSEIGPVLIVGAGIAGAALAIALHRAGITSIVYEASPEPRDEAGAFLNLAPNGLHILRELGLGKRSESLGFQNDRLIFQNDRGGLLADVAIGGVTLMRGELSRELREAAIGAGVRFEFGKVLDSVDEHAHGVGLRFSDGSSVTGRALVGADGIHSRVRQDYFPEAPRPRYTGVLNLGGIVRTDLAATGTGMHMIFGRSGFFGYAVRPSGHTYWFSNFAQREEPQRGSAMIAAADVRQRLLSLHRDDPAQVSRILQAVDGAIGTYAVYDIMSLPRWHRNRVCLIGDAAHALGPHVGQGASLALEDAFVLAQCLRDLADPASAFATFEGLRRERVERIVKQSRRAGEQKAPTSWFGRKIRDLILPVFLRKGAQSAAWMYAYAPDWNTRIASIEP